MGGSDAPYLYQRPSTYTFVGPNDRGFNPKSATQAAWAPKQPRPKPDGPLIDSKEMNRHPDSYFIVPYGNLDWKPMSPRTKTKVKWIRLVQLFLRICALAGAAGLLVCVICIKPTGNSTDWIIRIPPGIAILHNVYAIYHLSRSSKGRTPASSASYHIFSSIMDSGVTPFLAFTALMAYREDIKPIDDEDRWKTLFGDNFADEKVVHSTFLVSVTLGGIHVVSLCLSIYLALMFRKISNLPPDMNPLEDNLTSRTRSHKRNKSSMSTAMTDTPTNRDSHLSAPLMDGPTNRLLPFIHTRNDSAISFGENPERRSFPAGTTAVNSNRNSRRDLPSQVYQPVSQRSSRGDLHRSVDRTSGTPKRASNLQHSETTYAYTPESRPASMRVTPKRDSQSMKTTPQREPQTQSLRNTPQRESQRESLLKEPANENWFVHASSPPSSPERDAALAANFDESPPEFAYLRASRTAAHAPSPSTTTYHEDRPDTYADENHPTTLLKEATQAKYNFDRTPRPLEMNPPTPPVTSTFAQNRQRFEQRALQESGAAGNSRAGQANGSPATWEELNYVKKAVQGQDGGYGAGASGKGRFYGNLKDSLRVGRKGSRVVSSGVDVDAELKRSGLRGREVSGKVAEEGRAW